ncbi:MAG: molybdopterin molybdotransferase MoeA [Micrococcales bacterium]|nr:molybdopterin molybdotransferase MoeA [Micrococcales bacterium]
MIPVESHLARVLDGVAPLAPVRLPLAEALGCILAEDVVASLDLPAFTNSAMDGYAVRAADCAGASAAAPVSLPVAGTVRAGDPSGAMRLEPGSAVRIMTGAPVPEGADAIVPIEDTDGGETQVAVSEAPSAGAFVRERGEDFAAGDVVLRADEEGRGPLVMGPGRLALAAAAGAAEVGVIPRPRVVVVSTGDELVPAGEVPGPGQIVDSNSLMLAALATSAGALSAETVRMGDDVEALTTALHDAAGRADVVITSGGVSMGAFDPVKEALTASGEARFDKVAMKPGMPQGFGQLSRPDGGSTPVFTLPGNPVSALVSFHVFVLPALARMSGMDGGETAPWPPKGFTTHAGEDWDSVRDKVEFTRVYVDGRWARRSGGQGSHQLGAMASGMAIAIVPATATRVREGDTLHCIPLLGAGTPRE